MTCFPRAALLCLLALTPFTAIAAEKKSSDELAEAFALFSKGAYPQALAKAESIHSSDRETLASVHYFLGTTQAKLQAFDKAAVEFQKAIANGTKVQGVHYDLGQALYATQKMKEAEQEFRKSIIAKFKMGASAYYIAYIRTVLDDKPGAREFYARIGKLQNDPDKVKQSSLLQVGELSLDEANDMKEDPKYKNSSALKAKHKKFLETDVLALYRRARDYSPETPVADQARARIAEIENQLEQLVDRMRNGNPIPRYPYTFMLSQDFTYDSNVTTQADQALVRVSNADALIWKSGLLAKYQFNAAKTVSFIPELASSISYYSQRSNPSIYTNDNISITPALRTKLEHWSGSKPATMQLDLEFNLMLRDQFKAHQFPFYTRYYLVALSERVKWFEIGNTTLKPSLKLVEYYDPSKNSYSPSLSLTQLIKVSDSVNLVTTWSADYLHARDDTNDERNYKLRISNTFSQFMEKIDLGLALPLSLKDTMKQKGSRGNEFNLAPNVSLARPFSKKLDGTLEYTWTKNFSKAKDTYQYTKGEIHFGMNYNF